MNSDRSEARGDTAVSQETRDLFAGLLVSFGPVIPLGFILEQMYGSFVAGVVAGLIAVIIAAAWSQWTRSGETA